jgi:hypothetical protein
MFTDRNVRFLLKARMKACLWQKPLMPSSDGLTKTTIPTKSSIQEPYPPIYLQSTPANHSNPSPFLRNLSQQQTILAYHPTQILQQQRTHLPLNFNVNMLSHQHAMPTHLPYAANPQQINLNYYPQAHFVNRNVSEASYSTVLHWFVLLAARFSNKLLVHTINTRFLLTDGKEKTFESRHW